MIYQDGLVTLEVACLCLPDIYELVIWHPLRLVRLHEPLRIIYLDLIVIRIAGGEDITHDIFIAFDQLIEIRLPDSSILLDIKYNDHSDE